MGGWQNPLASLFRFRTVRPWRADSGVVGPLPGAFLLEPRPSLLRSQSAQLESRRRAGQGKETVDGWRLRGRGAGAPTLPRPALSLRAAGRPGRRRSRSRRGGERGAPRQGGGRSQAGPGPGPEPGPAGAGCAPCSSPRRWPCFC